uniref:Uncharacterized protein n=1 Tax=Rhizophora mucronata TaxID=61149 RepID=A0A2P2J6R5_RHIMU
MDLQTNCHCCLCCPYYFVPYTCCNSTRSC